MSRKQKIAVGIDIGTHNVKVLVAAENDSEEYYNPDGSLKNPSLAPMPKIIGSGITESKGVRHGYITNISEAGKSIRTALTLAEKNAGVPIKSAYLSIGGVGLGAIISFGTVATTKADSEITELDVKKAIEESEKELPNSYILNRKIIHTIPLDYKVDGKRVLGRPHGLKGIKLEARVLYITCLAHHFSDLLMACEEANIEVEDVVAAPIAASLVSLNKTQKIAGCLLANIGSETTSIIVYENNIPVSLEVFPVGANDITNDIALGLKVSIEEAEQIKLIASGVTPNSQTLSQLPTFSKKKLDEIIIARLSDIFDLIDDHLRRIDRSGLLPAGAIITGGGSGIQNIDELAKEALRLPSKQNRLKMDGNLKGIAREFEWTVAYGLTLISLNNDGPRRNFGSTDIFKKLLHAIKRILP